MDIKEQPNQNPEEEKKTTQEEKSLSDVKVSENEEIENEKDPFSVGLNRCVCKCFCF